MLSVVREYVETSMPCVDCHLLYLSTLVVYILNTLSYYSFTTLTLDF